MATLYTKVKKYLEANSKTWDDTKVSLQNDGSGDYIKVWSYDGLAKPTDDQLNSYNSAATTEENNIGIRNTRKNSYGSLGDQLDLIYKDIVAGKLDATGEWAKKIKAVKDANAKE